MTSLPPSDVRVSIRRPVSASGYVDAAWWPYTDDLSQEVPALLEVLGAAGRATTRVTYNLAVWQPAPRSLRMSGRTVHLGGFVTSNPLTVRLTDGRAERVDVLVIPPATDPEIAARALALAALEGSNLTADEVLAHASEPAAPAGGLQPAAASPADTVTA